MQLAPYQLQIFISLLVILGAACVAMICDFLKGNNEQLRELTIELTVRREEEQKRSQLMTPRLAERVQKLAAAEKPQPVPAAKEHSAIQKEKKRAVNSEALAAMERGAALAGSGKRRGATPRPVEAKPEAVPEVAATTARKDWGSLLLRNAQASKVHASESADLLAAVVAATNSSTQAAEMSLPAGFQDGFVLNKLVQSRQPFSGLVVSIGVNASSKSEGALPGSVRDLIQSLLGPMDFAAQSGEDEFLLIYPEEHGAQAQRRLSQIAQQLWDFQLRSLGSFQILFSWGGVEARSESLEEAIASASDRMQETKRGRKLLTMASPSAAGENQLRQAV